VRIATSLDDGGLAIVVRDDGEDMTPGTDSPGMGVVLALIANLSDSSQIDHDGGGTQVTMRFARAVSG
jgi:anti-sigma regulatory factor (Ser/Thr protein kinase)